MAGRGGAGGTVHVTGFAVDLVTVLAIAAIPRQPCECAPGDVPCRFCVEQAVRMVETIAMLGLAVMPAAPVIVGGPEPGSPPP